jgi:hypothetical protein
LGDPAALLSLPEEILLHILSLLPLRSLLAVDLTCRPLRALLSSSTLLQYSRQLQLTELTDLPSAPGLISDRLAAMRAHVDAWRTLSLRARPVHVHTPAPGVQSGIYDLSAGWLFLGACDPATAELPYRLTRIVHAARLPEPGAPAGQQPEWVKLDIRKDVVDIGVNVEELDLVVLLSSCAISIRPTPRRSCRKQDDRGR